MGTTLSDPQFWIVTAVAVAAVVWLVRSLRSTGGAGAGEPPCSSCGLAELHRRRLWGPRAARRDRAERSDAR